MQSREELLLNHEKKRKFKSEEEESTEKTKKERKSVRNIAKVDMKVKLERSRQSAKECRARKKLRYQYLEELVAKREQAVFMLRKELEMYRDWCKALDQGQVPPEALKMLTEEVETKSIECRKDVAKET
ncbi:cAMP-responsive element-binding protein-like 2 [Limulus polyphemus]|uniref:cAMP-responsive element-binding protein-like 2 n=1 Tax=Limulus polyphemus TaxID=6850 RepID=A0ABM1C4U5_LIMPO|nr:cAMP-responsive element-binding protein-like 2 [Limulus polyphemus]